MPGADLHDAARPLAAHQRVSRGSIEAGEPALIEPGRTGPGLDGEKALGPGVDRIEQPEHPVFSGPKDGFERWVIPGRDARRITVGNEEAARFAPQQRRNTEA